MELTAFIILFVLGILTILSENKDVLKFIYIPFLILFMIIVRLNAFVYNSFELDILTYAIEMKAGSLDIYYLREFVFWLGIRVIYFITNSDLVTFILLDIFWIHLLFKSSSIKDYEKLNNGLVIILATSFPFFFGYQNIYRQFYAIIILLLSYSFLEKRKSYSWILFIVSIFIHNLSLFVFPFFVAKGFTKFNNIDRLVLSSSISIIYIIMLPYLLSLKAFGSTGFDVSILYFILFFIGFLLFLLKFHKDVFLFLSNIPSIIPATIIITGIVYLQLEMISERVGMMFIPFLLYDLYRYSNKFNRYTYRMVFRLVLLLLFTLPVFLSSSSMIFLK